MTLIGLAGRKGSGKDTVGAYLVERYGYKRESFAEPLKVSAAAALNIPAEWWERAKNDPTASVIFEHGSEMVRLTAREFLQRYGTEAHRDVFGASFWTDMLIQKIAGDESDIVITDMRFENETRAVKEAGGITFLIDRPGTDEGDAHASEVLPPEDLIDYVIPNVGSIADLFRAVDAVLDGLMLEPLVSSEVVA